MTGRFALVVLLLAPLGGLSWAQTEYYASNESGMAFEEIPSFRSVDFDYHLELRRFETGETRTVRKRDGSEYRRWEYERDKSGKIGRVRFLENGAIAEIEDFRPDGRIASRESYAKGELESRTEYEYRDKRLVASSTRGPSGNLLHSDAYKYALNGSLREVVRTNADGRTESSGLDLSEGRIIDSWHSSRDAASIDRYQADGGVSDRERWEGATLMRFDSTSMKADGEGKDRQVVSDASRGVLIERSFDGKGRIAVETARKDGKLESRTEYAYDDSGRLSRKTFASRGRKTVVDYSYGRDGSKAGEDESVDGVVTRRVRYEKDGSYWEELFRDGEVAVRIRWADGWKREEEIVRDGQVVRRRDFK